MKVEYLFVLFMLCLALILFAYLRFNLEDYAQTHKKSIYVIRTHVMDANFIELWDKCLREIPNESLYMIYDNTNITLHPDFYSKYKHQIILINQEESLLMNALHQNIWSSLETTIAKCVLYLKKKEISYDYLWLLENDVYCDGNYYDTLQKADDNTEDFLGTYVEDRNEQNIDWVWWNRLSGDITNNQDQVKSLFCVTRYSKRFAEAIAENIGKSGGYCEVYIPTLAKKHNFTYGNLPSSMIGDRFVFDLLSEIQIKNNNTLHHKYIPGSTKLIPPK